MQNKNKFVLGEGKNAVDDNTNHRGARMVILIMNLIDILEEPKMLMMITTILSRGSTKKQSNNDWSSRRTDAAKDYWNYGYNTN